MKAEELERATGLRNQINKMKHALAKWDDAQDWDDINRILIRTIGISGGLWETERPNDVLAILVKKLVVSDFYARIKEFQRELDEI